MASITFYDYSVGTYTQALSMLLGILQKAAAQHPNDATTLLDTRLAPDMWPLRRQVQITVAFAAELAAALGSTSPQAVGIDWSEDEERTWPSATARVEGVLARLRAVGPGEAGARVAAGLTLPLRVPDSPELAVPATDSVRAYGLPNVFFHVYMAYAILRSQGVQLGKRDVLMPFLPPYIAGELASREAS